MIKEVSSFKGIPYADYFSVNTEWLVTSKSQLLNKEQFSYNHNENINININDDDNSNDKECVGCTISISLQVIFHKSTWLQGTIESNTKAELIGVFELWSKKAQNHIQRIKKNKSTTKLELEALGIGSSSNSNSNIDIKTLPSRTNSSFNIGNRKESKINDDSYASDEELLFYDCEEGSKIPKVSKDYNNNYIENDNDQLLQKGPTSTKDIAVTIVETIFVLFEFGIWRVHSIYMYEMKDLFRVHPSAFFRRTINAFLPGWHSPVLSNPDLYGPILAVFLLPQILLFSIESKNGCNRTALLGNAVVVSLCLWFGLSAFYRFLAFLIAPAIEFKHCMCMTGYSFFSWSLALLLSYPLEVYEEIIGIPTSLPLVIFGLPSAVALGCMFWEYTPASSMTLQPAVLPSSLQQFAQHNSRILQKLLWAVPKIIAFIIVTGTHYQFLWYVARVFLPGKKQLCRLSALLDPNRYSNIITQTEIRKFALSILKSHHLK